jgi:hypothetical protein
MSRDIGKARTPNLGFGFLVFSGSVGAFGSAGWFAGAVVSAFGVDGELAEELTGGGVDGAYVVAVDEENDGGSVEVSSEGDAV